jgi:condensin complex subunit 3
LIADATGRNSLFKIHVSLGKIVNALEKERSEIDLRGSVGSASGTIELPLRTSVGSSQGVADDKTVVETVEGEVEEGEEDAKTVLGDDDIKEDIAEELEQEETIIAPKPRRSRAPVVAPAKPRAKRQTRTRDSLVDELLSDNEDTEMTM